jgi:hypothetical protein
MVANSTNLKRITKLTGSAFIEDWAGKQIVLTTEKVKAFGEIHDAVRVSTKPVSKPKLEGALIDKAKAALLAGSATIESIKAKYVVSAEVEAALTNG